MQTSIQTLDSLYVNQSKCFLPLAKEAKRLAEEICKEKQAKQWAGIPHEKLLNQSFLDQLNSLQYTGTTGTITIGQGTSSLQYY